MDQGYLEKFLKGLGDGEDWAGVQPVKMCTHDENLNALMAESFCYLCQNHDDLDKK